MLSVSGSYRVFGCLALFHTLMALLTLNIQNSRSFRARCHNNFWPIKILLVIGLIAGSFFIEGIIGIIWLYSPDLILRTVLGRNKKVKCKVRTRSKFEFKIKAIIGQSILKFSKILSSMGFFTNLTRAGE